MTAALHFANPLSSDTIRMTGVDDGNNHGVCVGNNLPTNTIIGNGNIGDGNFLSPSAIEDEMLVKPADGSCADGDDTAKNTSSDEDEDENDDDDDFEIVSLEEERPPALHTAAAPISEEPRATSPRLQEEQNDRCREHHASLPSPSPSTKPLALFDSISKSIPRPQTHSEIVASPTQTTYHHHQRSLRPLLLQVPPYTPLLIDVAATFPVVAHIHPSSPLRDHVRLGDVLVYIDGKNSVQWSFEALTRRLNSDAFGADGVERKQTKKKREKEKKGCEEENGEDAEEEKEEKAPEEAGYRTLIVLPKEQFRQRPRSSGRRSRKKTCRKKDRENIGLVTPAKDRHLDEIAPCIATPTTTTTTTTTTNTTSISTAPTAAMTAIATTNDATPDDENDDDIENPYGQDPTTIAKQTNVVVVAPPPLPSATADNIATDDENKTHFQKKPTSAEEDNAATTSQNRVSMSEEDVESVRNSFELSNPMAVTEVDGNGLGEEGRRDDDEIDEEEEVEIIDEKIRHDVHIPTTAPPSATNKPSTPPEQQDEEEREYENLRKLVLRLQSQASPLSPHQRRIYEESYELLKERDRERRRNRPPVDIDVIAIRRRGDGCVSLKIRDRDDDNDNEDGEEEFSVEEVSTLYGGKWNPALYSASPRRLEDVWGYDVEEGYDCGGFHHLHRHHHHGNRYLTLAQGDVTAHDTAPISPSHHHNTHAKHHRLDIPHPNILGLLHPAAHRYRFDADARDALLQQQDDQVRRMALESLKRRQKRVEGFFVSLMFASVGALIVILVMVFWAKD